MGLKSTTRSRPPSDSAPEVELPLELDPLAVDVPDDPEEVEELVVVRLAPELEVLVVPVEEVDDEDIPEVDAELEVVDTAPEVVLDEEVVAAVELPADELDAELPEVDPLQPAPRRRKPNTIGQRDTRAPLES